MSRDPYIRLTYMIFDGNRKGIFGRLKIPNDSGYHSLIGLDLLELLHEEIKWGRRREVRLYKASLTEWEAKKVLVKHLYYDPDTERLPFSPVELFDKLNSHWVVPPPSDKVHLVVEILPEHWTNPDLDFF